MEIPFDGVFNTIGANLAASCVFEIYSLWSQRVSRHHSPWLIIGSVERIHFPAWDFRVKARVDTGAQSSSLHVDEYTSVGDNRVRFQILDKIIETDITRKDWVKSANGKEKRVFISASIRLGPVNRDIELSLANRKGLIYKMLLGRSAISGFCLVDPSRHYMLRQAEG